MVPTLVALIVLSRIDLSNEKQAQADVEQLLIQAGIPYEREVRLTDIDIVDFLIQGIALLVDGSSTVIGHFYRRRGPDFVIIDQFGLKALVQLGTCQAY